MTKTSSSPLWPVRGTLAARTLYMLCGHSFVYELAAKNTDVQESLAAIATLEAFGWPILFREIHAPTFGPTLGVHELAPSALQFIAEKYDREMQERPA